MLRRTSFLLAFFGIIFLSLPQLCLSKIHFKAERVELRIHEDRMEVTGFYFFWNDSEDADGIVLSYPFFGHFPDIAEVWVNENGDYKRVSHDSSYEKKSIIFPLFFPTTGMQEYKVRYVQKLANNLACYILTSTKLWKERLEFAIFEVYVSKELPEVQLSYQPYEVTDTDEYRVYRIEPEDFDPTTELCISWGGDNEPKKP